MVKKLSRTRTPLRGLDTEGHRINQLQVRVTEHEKTYIDSLIEAGLANSQGDLFLASTVQFNNRIPVDEASDMFSEYEESIYGKRHRKIYIKTTHGEKKFLLECAEKYGVTQTALVLTSTNWFAKHGNKDIYDLENT